MLEVGRWKRMEGLLNKKNRNQQGMTLLEVMIALTILSIGILMLTGMQFATINANASGYQMSTAVSLGEGLMERLKLLEPTDSFLASGNHNGLIIIPTGTGVTYFPSTVNGVTYNGSYTATNDVPLVGIKRVDLTVSWIENGNHSVTFTGRFPMP